MYYISPQYDILLCTTFSLGMIYYYALLFPSVETLSSRQKRAVELKVLTDRSGSMNEAEIAELRADIKVKIYYFSYFLFDLI